LINVAAQTPRQNPCGPEKRAESLDDLVSLARWGLDPNARDHHRYVIH
jgi:hypothetical protein